MTRCRHSAVRNGGAFIRCYPGRQFREEDRTLWKSEICFEQNNGKQNRRAAVIQEGRREWKSARPTRWTALRGDKRPLRRGVIHRETTVEDHWKAVLRARGAGPEPMVPVTEQCHNRVAATPQTKTEPSDGKTRRNRRKAPIFRGCTPCAQNVALLLCAVSGRIAGARLILLQAELE
jgi:hypothetical protein